MVSVISEKRQLENGDCSLAMCQPRYKRRKVSAVRQFPPGCGPNAIQMNLQKNEVDNGGQKTDGPSEDVESGGERGDVTLDVEGKGSVEKVVESQSDHVPICSSSGDKEETSSLVKSKVVEDGIQELSELVIDHGSNGLSKEMAVEDPKSSQDLSKMEEECMKEHEICGLSKEPMEIKVQSPVSLKNTVVLGLKEDGNDIQSEHVVGGTALLHHPIPSDLVWKKRKYPPRRRVSASRDFPPGCGCNVQQFDKADSKLLGQDKIDANPCKDVLSLNQIGGDVGTNSSFRNKMKEVVCGETGDKLEGQSVSYKDACAEVIMQAFEFGKSSEIKRQKEIYESRDCEWHGRLLEKGERSDEDNEDNRGSGVMVNKELIVYKKDKVKKKKPFGDFSNCGELQEKSVAGVPNEENVVVVQGLMATPNCPGTPRMVKSSPSTANVKRSKGKKSDHARQDKFNHSPEKTAVNTKDLETRSKMIVPHLKETETKKVSDVRDEGDSSESEGLPNDFLLVPRRHIDVTYHSQDTGSSGEIGIRSKVREILRLFQAVVRKLLQGEETKTKDETKLNDQDNATKRIDLRAAKLLKAHGKCVNTGKKSILGPIPGVEVGDFFHYRMELSIIGLHRPPQGGIDYLKQGGKIIATSIVASGGYANDVDSSDVLIYTGQGGNASGDKQAEDQKLERGNLALKNSIDVKNAVRVIRGFKESKPSESADSRPKIIATYTYDGLYTVEKYWRDLGPHGKLVYKFQLRRLPGQPELAWKEVKRSKKYKIREGRCVDDISGGIEIFPICAVNTIDDEKPPAFSYITRMMYPDWCQPKPPTCCDCKNGCSDSEHCACAVKNGGEIPYNYNGAIVEAKPLVYECGPSCKCPPTCHNRVSQAGIKLPLEIFKTESRGWGVRSLSSIPSGSFICEYLGELLDDKEAEQRTGSDEYLFDVGRNFNDPTLLDGLSTLLPDLAPTSSDVVENVGFTIDAAKYGNVGRFINHSCSPNLYAQNVLFDHADKRIPHVMLFAAENIPPLQELTYHYNYTIDQVFDSDGNVKKKSCYCGSSECTGRMY